MRIETSNAKALNLTVVSYFDVPAEDMKVKSFTDPNTKVTETKTSQDGRPVHRTDLQLLYTDSNGKPMGVVKNAQLALVETLDVKAGVMYDLDGFALVSHYQPEGSRQVHASITCDRLVPRGQGKPAPAQQG